MLEPDDECDTLDNFTRRVDEYLRHLHETGTPIVLTVDGKPEVVVQDAAAYRRLVELAANADRQRAVAAIREGLADVKAGRLKPAREVLEALAEKHGLPSTEP